MRISMLNCAIWNERERERWERKTRASAWRTLCESATVEFRRVRVVTQRVATLTRRWPCALFRLRVPKNRRRCAPFAPPPAPLWSASIANRLSFLSPSASLLTNNSLFPNLIFATQFCINFWEFLVTPIYYSYWFKFDLYPAVNLCKKKNYLSVIFVWICMIQIKLEISMQHSWIIWKQSHNLSDWSTIRGSTLEHKISVKENNFISIW